MPSSPLQIKVNALKRLIKEEKLYKEEVEEQEKHVSQLKANNSDPYEIKKQVEVLDESKRMIPLVAKKIQEHKEGLSQFLDTYSGDEDLTEAKSLI